MEVKYKSFKLRLHNHIAIPSPRPRTGPYGSFYVPNAAKNRKVIQEVIIPQIPREVKREIILGAVFFEINFYLPIPSSFSKHDQELCEQGIIRPITKPDTDNLVKTYMDALKDLVWLDDNQVVESTEKKFYSREPRVMIKITYTRDIPCSVLRRAKESARTKRLNKEILSEIEVKNRLKARYEGIISRSTNQDTIDKYTDLINELDTEILELQSQLEE